MITIMWKNQENWEPFDLDDIAHLSRNHSIHLFSLGIPVIAKQGDQYIVNKESIKRSYEAKGQKARLFAELAPDDRALEIAGFV